jgi:hypothetical protein
MPPYSLKPSWVKQRIDPCNFKRFLEKLILIKDSEYLIMGEFRLLVFKDSPMSLECHSPQSIEEPLFKIGKIKQNSVGSAAFWHLREGRATA